MNLRIRSRYGCAPSSSKVAAARARSGHGLPRLRLPQEDPRKVEDPVLPFEQHQRLRRVGERLGRTLDRHAGGRGQAIELLNRGAEQDLADGHQDEIARASRLRSECSGICGNALQPIADRPGCRIARRDR